MRKHSGFSKSVANKQILNCIVRAVDLLVGSSSVRPWRAWKTIWPLRINIMGLYVSASDVLLKCKLYAGGP
jgi:hypothetical protein